MRLDVKPAKILDFDIENRPLTYYGGDLTTAEITAIATSWAHSSLVSSYLLYQASEVNTRAMLEWFVEQYTAADIVTGHYIRKHDLPLINGALVEHGLGTLPPKLTVDTKLDLIKWSFEAQPKSQEELALVLGLEFPKVHMTQHDWRQANRLTPEGVRLTRERVEGDVRQHKALRAELTRRGLLGPPKVWKP